MKSYLKKGIALLFFLTILSGCSKQGVIRNNAGFFQPPPPPPPLSQNTTYVSAKLPWQTTQNGFRFVIFTEGLQITDYPSYHQNHVLVELRQEGDPGVIYLPYVHRDSVTNLDIYYTVKNDHPDPNETFTGFVTVYANQNTPIDFSRRVTVGINIH